MPLGSSTGKFEKMEKKLNKHKVKKLIYPHTVKFVFSVDTLCSV